MHELSIARNIVEVASQISREARAERVITVRVRIGALAGIAPESLDFSFDIAALDTPLEGSRLIVELAPVIVYCAACARETELTDVSKLVCAACGTPTGDVRSGRELEVESIEVI